MKEIKERKQVDESEKSEKEESESVGMPDYDEEDFVGFEPCSFCTNLFDFHVDDEDILGMWKFGNQEPSLCDEGCGRVGGEMWIDEEEQEREEYYSIGSCIGHVDTCTK